MNDNDTRFNSPSGGVLQPLPCIFNGPFNAGLKEILVLNYLKKTFRQWH